MFFFAGRILVHREEFSRNKPTDIVILRGSLDDRTRGAYDLANSLEDYRIFVINSLCKTGKAYSTKLQEMGIPADKIIIIDGHAESTHDESTISKAYFDEHPTDRQLVVLTSKYHSRRAGWIFKNTYRKTNRDVYAYATPYGSFDGAHWYRYKWQVRVVFLEWLKIAHYIFREKWL